MDKPIVESVGREKPINKAPISTPYYPMTVGNRGFTEIPTAPNGRARSPNRKY